MPVAEATVHTLPAFAQGFSALKDEERLALVQRTHPDYTTRQTSWEVLLDAFESSGGFLNGGYLWPYSRELPANFEKRQKMARYHNYLESLVDLYVRFMFTQGVTRSSTSREYMTWLEDVDGGGTGINDFMKVGASVALVHGHSGVLTDKTQDLPTGQTMADERARTVASHFTALAIPDWRFQRATLKAIKLIEAAPPSSIVDGDNSDDKRYLFWDAEGWVRCDAKGDVVSADVPRLGFVPVSILRPKPSYTSHMLGRALVNNANVIRAMYNRAAEEDEVIRAQAFSVLTVAVPPDGNVDQAKEDLGTTYGTSQALVVRATSIDYKTPDQNVPGTIRQNIDYLVHELYRAAHVRLNRDGANIESGVSIRLQYTELNEMLQGFAKELARCELGMARAWFAWNSPTPAAAEQALKSAKVEVKYPDEFFIDDLLTDLEAWAEAVRMDLGKTMTGRIKKKAARRIDPDMPEDIQKQVDDEIDAMKDEPELEPLTPQPLDRGRMGEQELDMMERPGA